MTKDYRFELKKQLESINLDIGKFKNLVNEDVFFDEREHVYSNRHTGEFYAGASEILSVKNKGFLAPWHAREAVAALGYIGDKKRGETKEEYATRAAEQKIKAQQVRDEAVTNPEHWEEMLHKAKGSASRQAKEAQISGTLAHKWIERSIWCEMNNEELPPLVEEGDTYTQWKKIGGVMKEITFTATVKIAMEACNAIQSYRQWRDKHEIRWHASELVVASDLYRFAGTLDGLCTLDGKLTLLDFKTSKAIYPEVYLQLEAYSLALEEMQVFPQSAIILRLPKDNKQAEVYANPFPRDLCRRTFLSLREAKKWEVYVSKKNG